MKLSDSLQEYLTRSSDKGTSDSTPSESGSGGSWFSRSRTASQESLSDDGSNGWFTQAQSDPCLPSLSKKQRVLGFIGCILLGTFCFSLASLYVPFLVLKARKFALLYTLGSLFVISSFSMLWGPTNHIKHLFAPARLPFTTAYFGTMFATLYFSLWLKSTPLTIVCAVAQILALIWYIVSYIPGGKTGMSFFTKIFYLAASKTVSKTLPV